MDNIYSERQHCLLTDALHASWKAPDDQEVYVPFHRVLPAKRGAGEGQSRIVQPAAESGEPTQRVIDLIDVRGRPLEDRQRLADVR